MKFIHFDGYGGPEVLELREGGLPLPGPGEVQIRVETAGVNRPDILQRKGHYPPPPGASPILGLEVAGTIAALGPQKGGSPVPFKVGDRVCALLAGGGYAEYCVAPAEQCLPVPNGLSFEEAAAIPEVFFTVWANVFERGRLASGESFLVHGGSSGIGTAAIQLAGAFGAQVFATAGSAEKVRFCRSLGAECMNYREKDFVPELRQATGGRGMNVILDMVGGDYFQKNLELLAQDGRLVQIAFQKGDQVNLSLRSLMSKGAYVTGSTLRARSVEQKGAIASRLREKVWPLFESGKIRSVIDKVFPLSGAADAHRRMEAGEHLGKIVLATRTLALVLGFTGLMALAPSGAKAQEVTFPPGFEWCTATAGHQIEGYDTTSDWASWEKVQGHVWNNQPSGKADDHWDLVDQDTAILKSMGIMTYRMSVEWSKIEPVDGQFDPKAIAHYQHEIALLESDGIRPMITLQHFTLPMWVRAKGGWEWSDAPARFARFVAEIYRDLPENGPGIRDWVTINEPMVNILGGYFTGQVPPGETRQLDDIAPVLVGLLKAHAIAYQVLHQMAADQGREIRVGIANHLRAFRPNNAWSPLDWLVTGLVDQAWNWALPEAVQTGELKINLLWFAHIDEKVDGLAGTQDFIGVNYYSDNKIAFDWDHGFRLLNDSALPKTQMGWDIYPEGFGKVLDKVADKFPGMPIYITENGIADPEDLQRPQFIKDHLRVLADEIAKGIEIDGYCYWSWLDNYEWINGTSARFGLYAVDYSTFERIPRPSAALYSDIIRNNGF